MKRTILLDHIDKLVTEKTYQQAREKERELSPERFTARYSGGSILRWGVIFFGFIALTVLFYFFNGILSGIAGFGAIGSGLLALYHATYRCTVDDTGLTVRSFFFFEKRILWRDVAKVKLQKREAYGKATEKELVLRNHQNKILYTCSYDLAGFNLIAQKAKNHVKQ